MNKEVAVIGVGMTQFGELWNHSFRSLITEAGIKSMESAGVKHDDIDGLFIGNMTGGQLVKQEHIASLVADQLGMALKPALRLESACASGSAAFRTALMGIKSGMHDIALVGGVEKMTDLLVNTVSGALGTASDQEWEAFYGVTFPGLYALIARAHMEKYGTTKEQLAQVAVKNHHNGTMNPNAQFRKEITVETVLNAAPVADPLGLFDCSPVSDGAASLILASKEKVEELGIENPIWVTGSGLAADVLSIHSRRDITTLDATVEAANQAYKQAGVTAKDIDLAEVHDCFTIAELLAIEDLGFCKKGEAGKFTEDGETALTGSMPINTSGGLKSKGHPVGATGIAQIIEVVEQLKGKAGERQLKDPKIGLTHNVGGSGGSALVHILQK